jgi:hypothetical protein
MRLLSRLVGTMLVFVVPLFTFIGLALIKGIDDVRSDSEW